MTKTSAVHQVSTSTMLRTVETLQSAICKGLRRDEATPFNYLSFSTPAVVGTLNRIGIRLTEIPVVLDLSQSVSRDWRLERIARAYGVFGVRAPADRSDRGVVLVVPKFSLSAASGEDSQAAFLANLSKIMALGLVESLARCEQVLRVRAMQRGDSLSPATSWITHRLLGDDLSTHPNSRWCDLDAIARVVEISRRVGLDPKLLEPQLFGFKTQARARFVAGMLNIDILSLVIPNWWRGVVIGTGGRLNRNTLAAVSGE